MRTVDHIPYLCCVADTKEFYGLNSIEFSKWEKNTLIKYNYNNSKLTYEDWLIETYISIFDKKIKTDIDMLTLPKVFKANKHVIKHIQGFTQQVAMDISINWKQNLVLVL